MSQDTGHGLAEPAPDETPIPLTFGPTGRPCSSTMSSSAPRNGAPHEPGFIGVSQAAPASGHPASSVWPHVLFT